MESPVTKSPARILIIDDHATVVTTLEYVLCCFGCSVLSASNGKSGVAIAAEAHPDLVLLDFDMPLFNGEAVLKELKSNPALQHLPVIVMTGRRSNDVIKRSMQAGAKTVIPKPFEMDELRRIIAEYLPPGKTVGAGDILGKGP
jgi:CheY-like chemotaxis protein